MQTTNPLTNINSGPYAHCFSLLRAVLNSPGQNILVSDASADDDFDFLRTAISISRIDDLLEQMRFHEVPKRSLFSIPFELAKGLVIGIKGYGLVSEQKKGAYKYFVDLGNKMEVVESRTMHVDEVCVRLYAVSPRVMFIPTIS